jgi:outer membrane receptor protein involved in Fe transport
MRSGQFIAIGAWLAACLLLVSSSGAASGLPRAADVNGTVLDQTGSAVPGARVLLLTSSDSELRSALTGNDGRFRFGPLEPAVYVLAVEKAGFQGQRRSVVLAEGQTLTLDITLGVGPVSESVTVTPARGNAQEVLTAPQFVTVTPRSEFARRSYTIFPQALAEEPGVHVQQTSTSQGSPFVRGLTGQQVVALIDGVRLNNATFRPGANQYTALIDTAFVDRVEIVRGPNAAQYGSDSLGGTINVLTKPESGSGARAGLHGSVTLAFGSGDRSGGGSAYLSGGGPRWGFLLEGSGHRAQDLRTGGGIDSHSVVTRLLGLPSTILGDRLQDTAYSQYGVRGRFLLRPGRNDVLTVSYLRGAQLGASRYDQLNGGLGNLVNRFDPQTLDFAILRYDRIGVPLFDSLSATVSFNGQRDDRTYQSVNNTSPGLRSPISEEHNVTKVFGYQAQAARRLGRAHALVVGGELYDEVVDSTRQDKAYSQATGDFTSVTSVRARFPNGAGYRTAAVFAQDIFPLWTPRLNATLAARYSQFRYSQSAADNPVGAAGPLVPTYQTTFGEPTFNTGLVFAVTKQVMITASVGRGFRAPNVNDFGAIGLSGGGFEISPDEAMRLNASVAPFTTGAAQTPAQIRTAGPLKPEHLYNYEVGAKLQLSRISGTVAWFDSEIENLIERRVVVLAPGAVGTVIGGQPIVRQDATGAVYTALSNSPVFVRTNAIRVRLRGAEGAVMVRFTGALTLSANASYVRGVDLDTGLPPGLENGLPPLHGYVGLRYQPRDARYWLEAYSHFAAEQTRFSANDLGQARIGGLRTKQEITSFFNNGAVARGLVQNGVLLATGETLGQVLTRVLGPDLNARVPLYTTNPGYATLNLRGGLRLSSRAALTVVAENLFDRNYRLMGSGIDGAGRSFVIRQSFTF